MVADLASPARVAIYYAPLPEDPLSCLGNTWLGRDPVSGEACRQPALDGIEEVTADPRRYGFHATLKPPMRLAPNRPWSGFIAAVRTMAASIAPFTLPALAVHDLHGFLALREITPCPALQALADVCVEQLDGFRARPSDSELARRRAGGLSDAQEAMLRAWGYPYVFETWFFHMTLTRRLSEAEKSVFLPAAQAYFAPALQAGRRVSELCVFAQMTPDGPFTIAERVALRG